MKTKDVIQELRAQKGLSQEELAAKLFVTRQAVSRWETGETIPNTDTLKLLSKLFDVSAVSLPANDGTTISARTFGDGAIAEAKEEIKAAHERAEQIKRIKEKLGVEA